MKAERSKMTGNCDFLQSQPQLPRLIKNGSFNLRRMRCFTYVCRCGHHSNVALIESLVLQFDHTIETRRRDGSVAAIGLVGTISARTKESQKSTFSDSFTYSRGPSTAISNIARASFANCLNPEPGNHSGTYLTLCVSLVGGTGESDTERTYWECVNEKCTGNLDPLRVLYRVFCRLQESVFMRLDVQTVRYIHDQRAGHA